MAKDGWGTSRDGWDWPNKWFSRMANRDVPPAKARRGVHMRPLLVGRLINERRVFTSLGPPTLLWLGWCQLCRVEISHGWTGTAGERLDRVEPRFAHCECGEYYIGLMPGRDMKASHVNALREHDDLVIKWKTWMAASAKRLRGTHG